MAKIQEQNLLLEDNKKAIIGTNSEGTVVFDGTDLNITSSGTINISITAGFGGKLIINDMRFPTADGTNGQVLKTDGEVTLTWTNVGSNPPTPPLAGQLGVFGGGSGLMNNIDYITISTPGNATDFGDLTGPREWLSACSNGSAERGCFGGGYGTGVTWNNIIDYITISAKSNAVDFGDLLIPREYLASTDNGTSNRGIFAGGEQGGGGAGQLNVIEYITISSASNATDFGDLLSTVQNLSACSNSANNRGVFAGGYVASESNVIQYITISTTGNATDFGDLTLAREQLCSTSNGVNSRGVFAGSYGSINLIDYINISSLGDAADFGDLLTGSRGGAATSNKTNNRGVIAIGYVAGYCNIIEYITISTLGNSTDFGDLTIEKSFRAAASNA
jgi:hypothetical protein